GRARAGRDRARRELAARTARGARGPDGGAARRVERTADRRAGVDSRRGAGVAPARRRCGSGTAPAPAAAPVLAPGTEPAPVAQRCPRPPALARALAPALSFRP